MRIRPGIPAACGRVIGTLATVVLTLGNPAVAAPLAAQDPAPPLFDRAAQGAGPAGDPIVIGREHSLHSEILGEERRYKVHLPDGYGDPDRPPRRHPVVYVLDGERAFDFTVGLVQGMGWGLEIPEHRSPSRPNGSWSSGADNGS